MPAASTISSRWLGSTTSIAVFTSSSPAPRRRRAGKHTEPIGKLPAAVARHAGQFVRVTARAAPPSQSRDRARVKGEIVPRVALQRAVPALIVKRAGRGSEHLAKLLGMRGG